MKKIIYSLSNEEYKSKISHQTIIGQDFYKAAYDGWVNNKENRQLPFNKAKRKVVFEYSFRLFMEWIIKHRKGLTLEKINEVFSKTIVDVGIKLSNNKDEIISICYPNYPRIGDKVLFHDQHNKVISGRVVSRKLLVQGKTKTLTITTEKRNGERMKSPFSL